MKFMAKMLSLMLAFSMLPLAGCSAGVDSATSSTASFKKPTSSVAASKADSETETESKSVIPAVNDYSKQTYKVTDIIDNLKIAGRYVETNSGEAGGYAKSIVFDHTGAMLSFNADCEGDVSVDMTIETQTDEGMINKYFLVVVDGVEQRVMVSGKMGTTIKVTLPVATGLKRGKHNFEIYRQFQLGHGMCNLLSITMNGVPTERPKDKDLYIEVFGDSITAGSGNLTRNGDTEFAMYPEKSSSTDSYGFLAAKALNADVSIIAQGGLAYTWGIGERDIYHFWNKTSFRRHDLGDYKAERQPDVVVINLGTNDGGYKNKGYTEAQLTEAAVKLLTQVRKDRPNAKIVWFYGMMGNELNTQIKAAVEQVGGTGSGFYYCEGQKGQSGGGGHPSKDEHKANADILANFIRGII